MIRVVGLAPALVRRRRLSRLRGLCGIIGRCARLLRLLPDWWGTTLAVRLRRRGGRSPGGVDSVGIIIIRKRLRMVSGLGRRKRVTPACLLQVRRGRRGL